MENSGFVKASLFLHQQLFTIIHINIWKDKLHIVILKAQNILFFTPIKEIYTTSLIHFIFLSSLFFTQSSAITFFKPKRPEFNSTKLLIKCLTLSKMLNSSNSLTYENKFVGRIKWANTQERCSTRTGSPLHRRHVQGARKLHRSLRDAPTFCFL